MKDIVVTLIVSGLGSIAVARFVCAQSEPQAEPPEALIVMDEAEDVQFSSEFDDHAVSYSLRVAYPAPDFIRDVKDRLAQLGWKPQVDSYWNPGMPTSHATGWNDYIDGTVDPEQRVHQWWGEWLDQRGNLLIYVLDYRHPPDKTEHSPILNVRASLTVAPTAPRSGLETAAEADQGLVIASVASQFLTAWRVNDWASMDLLVDSQWVLVDWQGRVWERETLFVTDSPLAVQSLQESDGVIRHFGAAATITGIRQGMLAHGEPFRWRFTDFFARRDGEWRIVASHLTSIIEDAR